MKCNFRVMLSVAVAMAVGVAAAFFLFEGARGAVLASVPILAALLCPISLLIVMKMMMQTSDQPQESATKPASVTTSLPAGKGLSQEAA